MKNYKTLFAFDIVYIAVMILCSAFYSTANFDERITNILGLSQLIFTIISLVVCVCFYRWGKGGLPIILYFFMSLAQIVPIYNWAKYIDHIFNIYPKVTAMNWLWLTVHIILLAWGVAMILGKKLSSKKSVPPCLNESL